jgi:uncharacterized protein YceH (UPF0502 family)
MSDETDNPPGETTDQTGENEQAQPARIPRKRILTKDLSARIAELERGVAELNDRLAKLEGLADQIAKLDERINKLALAVAQAPLRV